MMISVLRICIFIYILYMSFTKAHSHDETSKCFLTGVHRTRQTIIESPNYPNNYKADVCWDYVIRSPFKCPTKFHVQFLEFDLEFSKDCQNDYLAIGLENVDDDMDILCGRVVGIKKYHTPDGVLRLRFFADESPWTTGRGFKLLITRLACEREELLRNLQDDEDEDAEVDDSLAVTAPPEFFEPPESELMQIFRNLTGQGQYQTSSLPSVYGLNYPTQLPSPPYPATGTVFLPSIGSQRPLSFYPGNDKQTVVSQPCANGDGQQRPLPNVPNYYGALKRPQVASGLNSVGESVQTSFISPNNFNSLQLPQNPNGGLALPARDQYIGSWSNTPSLWRAYDTKFDALEKCCVSDFQQKRFYLSSPGFPRTIFSNILPNMSKRDCVFRLQKSAFNICRLRLDMKFFDFGQNDHGTGSFSGNIGQPAIESTQDVCQGDFLEIDDQRFCGCRSGLIFTSHWPLTVDKKLRIRMGFSGVPSGGFLLELVQEECSETEFALATTETSISSALSPLNPNQMNNQQDLQISMAQQNPYGNSYPNWQQQQHPQKQNSSHYNTIGQQVLSPPVGFPTYLQQPNLLLSQQPQFLQNHYLHPSGFGSNYFTAQALQQNLPQPPVLNSNPFGLPQIRYARSYSDQQPITVVETNSTRKEYYYVGSEGPHDDEPTSVLMRPTTTEKLSIWDRKDTNINEGLHSIGMYGRERRKCTFDMGDILRLSVDILWITKPICYAPQRNWLTNWIG